MKPTTSRRILAAACIVGLLALALMVWSLLDARWLPVIVAMSTGQLLGTLSLFAFAIVVIADLRRGQAARARKTEGPSDAPLG